jgi:hypothetical protein
MLELGGWSFYLGRRRVLADGLGNGIDALKNLLGGCRVGDFQTERFVEGHDQLQGVDRIEAEAAGAEQRLIITDFFGRQLEHEVLDHHRLDLLFQSCCVFHAIKSHRLLSALSL